MRRFPTALGLALAIVAAGIAYISTTPSSTSPVVVDMSQVAPPTDIRLPALPDAIHVVNIAKKSFCIYFIIPNGIVVNDRGTWANVTDPTCFFRDRAYPYNDVYITFNGTAAREGWDVAYRVVKPPVNATIHISMAYT